MNIEVWFIYSSTILSTDILAKHAQCPHLMHLPFDEFDDINSAEMIHASNRVL